MQFAWGNGGKQAARVAHSLFLPHPLVAGNKDAQPILAIAACMDVFAHTEPAWFPGLSPRGLHAGPALPHRRVWQDLHPPSPARMQLPRVPSTRDLGQRLEADNRPSLILSHMMPRTAVICRRIADLHPALRIKCLSTWP